MKKLYISILALALSVSACDTFDKVPSSEWPSEDAISTLEDLEYAVNGVYQSQTASIDNGTNPRGSYAGDFTLYADMRGSDFQCIGKNNQATDVSKYQATKNSSDASNFYKRFYLSLARINKIFDGIDKAGLSGDEVDAYMGELYALRAMFHFDLARLFAKLPSNAEDNDLGIVLSTQVYGSDYIGERATITKTYETILSDLQLAIDKLPENDSKVLGHLNYWGARALRARVYLYMNKNAEALSDAQYVIEHSPYQLLNRNEYAGSWAKEGSNESIFEIQVTSLYNAQRNSLGYYTHAEGYAEAGISNSFKEFLQSRPKDNRSTLIAEETDTDGKTNKGWYMQKYPGRDGQIYVNSPKVIRLSEVYLIAAEAAQKTGGDAAKYVNELRRNRIQDYTDVTTVTLDDILTERRLELYGEGHSAWDYWRNKQSVNNAAVKEVKYDDYRTVMPIPVAEINVSRGKLIQNEGY